MLIKVKDGGGILLPGGNGIVGTERERKLLLD